MNPVLSIIVVTYNASAFLPSTIESLKSQRSGENDTEILLIDGGSSDETVEIARESGVFTTILSEDDGGIYDAMNKGAKIAKGEWLHFLNAGDSFYDDDSLSSLVRSVSETSAIWSVSRAVNLGGGVGPHRVIPSVPHRWYRHALGLQPHCHQATYVRASVFASIGGHSTNYGTAGDFDLIVRLGALGEPLIIDEVLVRYLGGGVSDGAWRVSGREQHRVRVDRFQLSPALAFVDARWVTFSQIVMRARVRLGKLRSALAMRG